MNWIAIIALCLPLLSGGGVQGALKELDRALEQKERYVQLKQSRIAQLKQRGGKAADSPDLYHYYDDLFDEYYRFDVDSAFFYAHQKIKLARQLDQPALLRDAALDLAARYILSGMYENAQEMLEQPALFQDMTHAEEARYYQALHSLYHYIRLSNKDLVMRPYFQELERYYQLQSEENLTPDMLPYYTVKANILIGREAYQEARALMMEYPLDRHPLTNEEQYETYYWIAKSYLAEGNIDLALQYYATSAYYDVITCYTASRSLVQTARLLLQKQDIDHAYRYITHAYEGAYQIDARTSQEEVAQFMPDITDAYESLEKRRYAQLFTVLILTLFLLTFSIVVLAFTRRIHNRLTKANRQINDINSSLQEGVVKLKEANDIKESYLGRYLSMFSGHINSLERYRSSLRGVAKSMDLKEIQNALKSDDFIDAERETLFQEFDRSFLGIFPDFVPQLNALLEEDKRIGQNLPEGKLSNELRIFALIRLGVTESAKIAQFLKKSPSTVYNYRVKLRNAALCPHQEFEQRLMEIGKAL